MRNLLDIKRMRYIVEVARAEAITTASRLLNISQPALTRNIAEVEEELGIQIFHRLPRGIQLTQDGQRFVSRAKRIIEDVDDLASEIGGQQVVPTGRLRIGFTPAGYLGYAVSALEKLAEEYPSVSIETTTGTPQAISPRLLHGELDLVVGSSSYLERWKELEIKKLFPSEFVCVFRKRHPIAAIEKPTELDVLQYPVAMPESVELVYSDIAQRYVDLGLPKMRPHYVSDNFRLILRWLRKSDAFYPLNSPSADIAALEPHFHIVRNAVNFPNHHVSVATSSHRPKSRVTEIFENLLIEQLS